MFCQHCGKEIPEGANFCPACGTQPGATAPTVVEKQTVVIERPQTVVTSIPTHLCDAILVTLLCCLPFGIVGIVYASQVSEYLEEGNVDAARKASTAAMTWNLVALACGVVGWLVAITFSPLGDLVRSVTRGMVNF